MTELEVMKPTQLQRADDVGEEFITYLQTPEKSFDLYAHQVFVNTADWMDSQMLSKIKLLNVTYNIKSKLKLKRIS